jgi:hypothetical protein
MPAIRRLNDAAFGGLVEGAIIDALRAHCPGVLSLVAADGERVVGTSSSRPSPSPGWWGSRRWVWAPWRLPPNISAA